MLQNDQICYNLHYYSIDLHINLTASLFLNIKNGKIFFFVFCHFFPENCNFFIPDYF